MAALAFGAAGRVGLFAQDKRGGQDLFAVPLNAVTDFYLTSKHFEPLVNTCFEVVTGQMGFQLTLKEVAELASKANQFRGYYGESFSLMFEGPRNASLVAGTYEFKHERLGEFSLFVSPVGKSGTDYEVIVNRIRR